MECIWSHMLTYRYPPVAILSAVEDTTFLQDAYEEMNDTGVYGDELITNHRLKKIKPIYVNYARTAKRVDVRRLKDNLWKTLTAQPVSFYHFSLRYNTSVSSAYVNTPCRLCKNHPHLHPRSPLLLRQRTRTRTTV